MIGRFRDSEGAGILHALNLITILATEGLVDVVGVGGVLGPLDLVGVGVALGKDGAAHMLVLLHHLNGKNVVDLDVMGGDAVVEEVGGEHHVVAGVPELGLVLRVEVDLLSRPLELHAPHHTHRAHGERNEPRVVHGAAVRRRVDEAREHGPRHRQQVVRPHVHVVRHFEGVAEGVGSHTALSNSEEVENPSDGARAGSESIVDEVLQAFSVGEEESLNTLCHNLFIIKLA